MRHSKVSCRVFLIGVLISLTCFCGGVVADSLVETPQQVPVLAEKIQVEHHVKSLSEKAAYVWEKTWDDAVAFYTAVLGVFTGLLVVVSGLQGFFLLRADKTARIAANAADLSARAAIALQLPIIRVTPATLGWGDSIQNEVLYAYCDVGSVTFSNLGETKAFPIEFRYGLTVGEPLPSSPSYKFTESFVPNLIFEPVRTVTPMKRLAGTFMIGSGDWPKICVGEIQVWFYCVLTFEDFMQVRHDAAFCWKWTSTGSGMAWSADATPAYTKKT